MNTLRRKLQFQLIQIGGGDIQIIKPTANEQLNSDTLFEIKAFAKSNQNLQIFLGDTLLGEFPFDEDNVANGYISISSNLLGIGGAYFVDDTVEPPEEIPANSPSNVELIFKSGKLKGVIRIYMKSEGDFIFDKATAEIKLGDFIETYDMNFDKATAEIKLGDFIETYDMNFDKATAEITINQ